MNNFLKDAISISDQPELEISLPQIEETLEKIEYKATENISINSDDLSEKFEFYLSNVIKTEEIIALENQLYNLMLLEDTEKTQKGLPIKYFKRIKKMKVGFATKQCSVCVSHFLNGDVIRKLPCGHIYHEDCLKPWLKKHTNCPLCRLDLLDYFNKLN